MSKARFLLVILICASPAVLLWDGVVAQGLIAGIVAIVLAITATTLRPGETEFLISNTRFAAAVAAVPVLCILFQLLPLRALAHPVWLSAETALGQRLEGTITIDRGASLIALGQYIGLCAVAFLAAAVAVERGRAESLLFALTAAGAAIALVVIAHHLLVANIRLTVLMRAQAVNCVAMGAIIAAAACIRTVERYETRQATPQRSVATLLRTFIACAAAFAVCALALVFDATRAALIATGCGLAAFACVVLIRRFGLTVWSTMGLAIPVIGVAVLVIGAQPTEHGRSILLAFSGSSSSSSAVSERVLDDAPLIGTGAGTFAAIAPVYREMDDPPPGSTAATTAATFAIELGRPLLWLIAVVTVVAIVILLRASLQRGRDSFYPAMGAGSLITLLLLGFLNAGLLGNAPGLMAAGVLGLAIVQSKSRTMQPS
ncbi:MAG: hypothetical protein WBF58_23405 [Xanthobacteraceae bacterium]